jgi:hypothetical protein
MADSPHGHLTPAAKPQMSMFEEESRPMLFRRDRVVRTGAQQLDLLNTELEAAGRPRFFPYRTRETDACLMSERLKSRPG